MGTGLRNLFCSVIFIICFILQSNAAAAQQKKHQLPFLMVIGTVYCDTCFQQEFARFSHFIPGASVAVKCDGFQKEVKTNQHGLFKIRLPVEVIKSCSVKLVRSSQPFCSVASSATPKGLQLKSIRNDVHVFSAGVLRFTPLKKPDFCNQKRKLSVSAKYLLVDQKKMKSAFFFMPPPIPFLPSPPNIGGFPLPPNPFQPTPTILPPLPIQPPPPPFFNIPLIPSVPPFPTIPTIAPPPPPPPASVFPPLPIPPIVPGNPPAFPAQRNTP